MRPVPALLIMVTGLWAGGPATGGYPGAFARVGYDARSMALAGALLADINSGFLALTNPASTVHVQKRELGLSYLSLPLDRNLQSLSLAFRLPPTAAAGISYLRAGDDNIQGRNSIGEGTGRLAYAEQMAILTFANRLGSAFSMGLNFKLLWIDLEEEGAKGFGIDFGLLYHTPGGFNLALSIQNITGAYAWKVSTSEGENIYDEQFPRIISIGIRAPWRHFTFFGQTDVVIPAQESAITVTRLAIEDRVGERYFLRLGLEHTTLTMGVGLRYAVRQPLDSGVDYSLSMGKNGEGLGHIFTWRFNL
ncbi:MAG: hypothetical protein IID14_00875 [Candidatus Marinimicrobia bacterium]|nr:hypothetical protein [Candidatus Neomarinimicrobiota bacterium]